MGSVHGDMTIAEVLKLDKRTVEVFLKHGMHCFGCHIGFEERVHEAARAHGVDADKLIADLNKAIQA
ncbi:MAG: DUF1858 domain-containing protein [Bacillota bacterium]